MPRFAANLTMLYNEHPFLERFAAAARDGFRGVEYLFPYEWAPETLAELLLTHDLTQALFNMPPGDWAAGERGIACLPGRDEEFEAGVATALSYARAMDCKRLHMMAGLKPAGLDEATLRETYVRRLRYAAQVVASDGITVVIEPINTRDMPGYFLNFQQQAHDLVAETGQPNVAVQMDFYHCQIMEGDLIRRLERHSSGVGHVQIAGVPDRHEPDLGEVHFPAIFEALDRLGYSGWVGCEYRPRASTSAGLGWFQPWAHRDGS